MEIGFRTVSDEDLRLKASPSGNGDEKEFYFINLADGTTWFRVRLRGSEYDVLDRKAELGEAEIKEKVDEWLVEYNPAGAFGSEDTEMEGAEVWEVPYDPESIRVDTKSFSLRQIYDMIESADIDLTPDFQRHLVWDRVRQSRLIESILLRIPLPMFYFAQDEEGRISVVDGLQRLSTIHQFMKNEFKLNNLEYLQDKCGGRYYTSFDNQVPAIEPKYYRWFNMTQITVNVIDPSSPFSLKYDIFRRINTGGQPLNNQEIRNCLASKALRQALRTMASMPSFLIATGYSVKDVRMEAQEFALRFILFHRKYQKDPTLNNYTGNIEAELNNLTSDLMKEKTPELERYIGIFDQAMQNAYHLFGSHCFRKSKLEHLNPGARRQQINKALFLSWSVLLAQYDPADIATRFDWEMLAKPLATKISEDNDFFLKLSYGTNAKLNLQVAFKAAETIIQEHLPAKS
jgi:Protein of unknown function DUF262